MLLYHPYKDSNHCIFRMLTIISEIEMSIELEKLKVLDFYYLFPHFIKDLDSWPRDYLLYKKEAKLIPEPFEKTPNKKKLFFELEKIQNQAITKLSAREILSLDSVKNGFIRLNQLKISNNLLSRIEKEKKKNATTVGLVSNCLSKFEWKGDHGLKKRSGLMEYKYDE